MKRKRTGKKISLFSQYLLLYFMAAFIPAVTACGSLFFSYQALENEVVHSNQASVKLIQQSLDTKILELDNTLLAIEQDPALTRYALNNTPLTALSSLEKTTALQDFLSNIIINVHGKDTFYSSSGSYTLSDLQYQFFMRDLIQSGYSEDEWLNMLNSVTVPTYWPINAFDNMPDYLYLFAPINSTFQYTNKPAPRVAVLLIKQQFIQDLFRSSQTSMEENILLLNSEMDLLSYFAPRETETTILEICTYLKENPEAAEKGFLKLDNDNLLFISQSQNTGFYYIRFLPEQLAYETIYSIRTYTITILVLVFFIGLLLITLGMRRSYTPIRTLADWVRSNQPNDTEFENELTFFKQVFDDAFEKNASLSQTIDNSRHGLTDHLITALIRGNFSTEETFRNACKNLGIHLDKKYYSVCSILMEENSDAQTKAASFESILATICRELPDELVILAKDLLFADKLLLVLNSDSNDPAFYQSTMTNIKKRLLDHEGLLTSIGMGSFYDSYEMVGKSYLESANALDYRLIYGKDCLITPDMYNNHLSEISYPSSDLNLLYSALMSHNTEMAITVIHRISDYTKSKNCSLHAAKYICYDTFSVLKKMPSFTNIGYVNTWSQSLNITHLASFDTVDEFFVSLLDIVQNTISSAIEKDTASNSDIGQQLVDYINTHCFAYDFQISSMAEHFSISPQYMRKLFKNHTGVGISEYISNIKLEKAMYLLRDTDMNLQDIVIEIGNTDVSGFVRSFKQKTGMTPGQYRKTTEV